MPFIFPYIAICILMSYFLILKFFVFIFLSTIISSMLFSSDNDAVVDDNESSHYSWLSIMD